MALDDLQDWSWVASGCEAISLLVFSLYDFKAAAKMVSKFVEEVAVGRIWDMMIAE
jgi:hypothetical protein